MQILTKSDIKALEKRVELNYLRDDGFKVSIEGMFNRFEERQNKLDNKIDRLHFAVVQVAEMAEERPMWLKQKEVMRLLGGISITKLRNLIKLELLTRIQPDDSGAVFFARTELEELTKRYVKKSS